jgi:hypothetical protein
MKLWKSCSAGDLAKVTEANAGLCDVLSNDSFVVYVKFQRHLGDSNVVIHSSPHDLQHITCALIRKVAGVSPRRELLSNHQEQQK